MDIREVPKGEYNRHPWEISRANIIIALMTKYRNSLHKNGNSFKIANIGAGDLYVDKEYLKAFPGDSIWAIDTGYREFSSGIKNLFMATNIDDVGDIRFDAVLMMDLLDYLEDELCFLDYLSTRLNPDAIIFFTLPAFQFLYSEHDEYVENLRRYSDRDFKKLIKRTQCLDLQISHYFYSSLFLVRAVKKLFHIPTDKDQKNVPLWKYPESHTITKAITFF